MCVSVPVRVPVWVMIECECWVFLVILFTRLRRVQTSFNLFFAHKRVDRHKDTHTYIYNQTYTNTQIHSYTLHTLTYSQSRKHSKEMVRFPVLGSGPAPQVLPPAVPIPLSLSVSPPAPFLSCFLLLAHAQLGQRQPMAMAMARPMFLFFWLTVSLTTHMMSVCASVCVPYECTHSTRTAFRLCS